MLKILEVRYIGRCKPRDNNTVTAFGWMGGEWRVIFTEKVLRAWFEDEPAAPSQPTKPQTYYAVLGAKQGDSADALKTAYRRMVKHTHPDVNKEADAHEKFLLVQNAFGILSDPSKRARYDAGLAMEASVRKNDPINVAKLAALDPYGYRSPLRSGLICAEIAPSGKWIVVKNILGWEDVVRSDGKTLVSSWPMGAKLPTEIWS